MPCGKIDFIHFHQDGAKARHQFGQEIQSHGKITVYQGGSICGYIGVYKICKHFYSSYGTIDYNREFIQLAGRKDLQVICD